MFEHVTILLSFVFALALTHLLSSTTELILARDRVRFSGLHALWTGNALLSLLINWTSLWGLIAIKHWSVSEVVLQFAAAIIQYFTCSTLSINHRDDGLIDVQSLYERQRPVIFASFLALMAIGMLQNYWDRNNTEGLSPTAWIGEDLSVLPMVAIIAIAGWARRKWLQWTAGVVMVALQMYFLCVYAMPV